MLSHIGRPHDIAPVFFAVSIRAPFELTLGRPGNFGAVGDVFEDRLRERVWLLEHHANSPSDGDRVDLAVVEIVTAEANEAFDSG